MMFEMFTQLYRNYFKSGTREGCELDSLYDMYSSKFPVDSGYEKGIESATQQQEKKQIANLERQISNLLDDNKKLQNQLEYSKAKELDLHKVLANYDDLLKKVVVEKGEMSQKHEKTQMHLVNLETAFYDLLQKYEKAKQVVQGFQQNEQTLKKQLDEYETVMKFLKPRPNKEIKAKNSKTELDSKKRRLLTTIS